MIVSFLLGLFISLLDWLTGWLPTAVLPAPLASIFTTIQLGINLIQTILPIQHIFYAGAAFIALEGGILAYKVGNEIMKKVRGSG